MLGENAQVHPNTVKQAASLGMIIADRSWNHPTLPKLSKEKQVWQVNTPRDKLEALSGQKVTLLRPRTAPTTEYPASSAWP